MNPEYIEKYGRHTWIRSVKSNIHINKDGKPLCGQHISGCIIVDFPGFKESQVCHSCLHIVDPSVKKPAVNVKPEKTIFTVLGNESMMIVLVKLQYNKYRYIELRDFIGTKGTGMSYVAKLLVTLKLVNLENNYYSLTYKGKLLVKLRKLIQDIDNITLKEMDNYRQDIHTLVMYGEHSLYWEAMIRKVIEEMNKKNE